MLRVLRRDGNTSKTPDSPSSACIRTLRSPAFMVRQGRRRRMVHACRNAMAAGLVNEEPKFQSQTKNSARPNMGSSFRQRRPDRLEVAPGEPLFERRAQQIGRVEGRDGANFPRAGMIDAPAAARPA